MPQFIRFVADVHLGNHKQFGGEMKSGLNVRCRRIIDALASSASGAEHTVVLGDLFDTSHPSPQMIASAIEALKLSRQSAHLLLGNHDMVSSSPGDHALAPLAQVTGLHVYEKPYILRFDTLELVMVPFRPEPMNEWFAETVGDLLARSEAEGYLRDQRAVCFHGGVRDHNTPKFLWGAPDSIDLSVLVDIMQRGNIDVALCGNWHNPRMWNVEGKRVFQVGALVPTGFDNPGLEFGTAVDFDMDGGTWHVVQLTGPKFVKVATAQLPDLLLRARFGKVSDLYLKVQLQPGETEEDVRDTLSRCHVPPSDLAGLVYAPATELSEQQEVEAAEAARSAESLHDALREYVDAMPLPDGVERSSVHSKVLTYMGRE